MIFLPAFRMPCLHSLATTGLLLFNMESSLEQGYPSGKPSFFCFLKEGQLVTGLFEALNVLFSAVYEAVFKPNSPMILVVSTEVMETRKSMRLAPTSGGSSMPFMGRGLIG